MENTQNYSEFQEYLKERVNAEVENRINWRFADEDVKKRIETAMTDKMVVKIAQEKEYRKSPDNNGPTPIEDIEEEARQEAEDQITKELREELYEEVKTEIYPEVFAEGNQ